LQSIEDALGSAAYPRLRLGVGAAAGVDLADWVLGPFTPAEHEALPAFVDRAACAVESVVALGVERAQPLVNAPPAA
jgi:PTH1 family peptidyl-tRNA hydrolase